MMQKALRSKQDAGSIAGLKQAAKEFAQAVAKMGVNAFLLIVSMVELGVSTVKGVKNWWNNRKKISVASDKYTGGRTQEELNNLAKDPEHKNTTNKNDIAKGIHERKIGLDLEKRGKINTIIRDPTGKAEFIENKGNGQKWDIKSFNSNYPPRKGGFKLERDLAKIVDEIKQGENVIVETTNMSSEHINALKNEINKIGLKANVIFWP